MKNLILALTAAACLSVHADPAADIYQQGLIAVREGNVTAAERAFQEVLRLQPGNANARYQLSELKQNQGSIAAREVTLQVKNVPAKAMFEMLLEQAGAVAKYEEHAIVIRPVVRASE
jgi:TolA-binding protein